MVQPGGAPVRARLVPGARGKLRVAGQQVRAGEVASHLAAEDRLQHVLDLGGEPRAGHVRLLKLAGALEQRLVRVDVPRRNLREQPVGGGCLTAVDGAQRREVQRPVGQRTAGGRELLERDAGRPRPVRRPQRERPEPAPREIVGFLANEPERLGRAPRLQLRGRALQRTGFEVGSQLRLAVRGRHLGLALGRRGSFRAQRSRAERHEAEQQDRSGEGHGAFRKVGNCGTRTGRSPVREPRAELPPFHD